MILQAACFFALVCMKFATFDCGYHTIFLRIVKQQLAFLQTVENKLKGALGNSKSFSGSGEKFNIAVTFALPATDDSRLTDSALWALGEPLRYARPDGELDEEDFDELDDQRETELLKTRIMTPEAQREWASSAPEMKEVHTCFV